MKTQLTKHIDEGIAMEESVLRMLRSMVRTTDDRELQRAIEAHMQTTEEHIQRLTGRLRAHGARRSVARQAGGFVAGTAKGVADIARREKPARNARDGFATEQMEVAAYELLERIARQAGDEETAEVARRNRAEDKAMAQLIGRNWDKVAKQALSATTGNAGGSRVGQALSGVKQAGTSATRLARNPLVLGVGSVVGGLLLGRRLQASSGQQQRTGTGRRGAAQLQSLTKSELHDRAQKAGIPVTRRMTKQELIDRLQAGAGRRAESTGDVVNPAEVQRFLEGVRYPASKDQLVRAAQRKGADARVRNSLASLPATKFAPIRPTSARRWSANNRL
jgi:ferritin-like metal-binding protein YciE